MSLVLEVKETVVDKAAYRWRGHLVAGELTLILPGFIAQWFSLGEKVRVEALREPHKLGVYNVLTQQDFRLWRLWRGEEVEVWPLFSKVYEHRGRKIHVHEAYLEEDFTSIAELEQYHYASRKEFVAIWKCPLCGQLLESNIQPNCPKCGEPMKLQEIKGSIPPSRFLLIELLNPLPHEPKTVAYVRVDTPIPLMHRRVGVRDDRPIVERNIREKVFPLDWIHPTFWPKAYSDVKLLMTRYRELRKMYSPRVARKMVADERLSFITEVDTASARIARVVVHPDYRGDGLGVFAVKAAVDWIRERRIPEMKRGKHLVETVAQMARYNPFFERAGFKFLWETASGRPVLYYPLTPEAEEKINKFLESDPIASKHGGRLYKSRLSSVQPLLGALRIKKLTKIYRDSLDISSLKEDLQRVLKAFGVEERVIERYILRDVEAEIEAGEIVAVTGLSGAGKTTLLRMIIGACKGIDEERYRPTAGRVEVPENVRVSYLLPGEAEPVFGGETVLEHVAQRCGDVSMALEILSVVGVSDAVLYRARFEELSTGQKERVKLASLLAERPNLLIIDEFCAHLDPETARRVARRMTHTARKIGLTMILSIHRLELLEELNPDKIIHIGYGSTYIEQRKQA